MTLPKAPQVKSRKAKALLFQFALIIANDKLNLGISHDAINLLNQTVMAYLVGQGIADMKK